MRAVLFLACILLLCCTEFKFNNPGDPRNWKSSSSLSYGGQAYRTVKIGSQTWMAENLDYDVDGRKCYGNLESNCEKYGRLYDWAAAMSACPSGWRLPTKGEWDALAGYVEGDKGCSGCDAKHLKAASGWNSNGNGLDSYGFAALPGGGGNSDGHFGSAGYFGSWWSASEGSSDFAYDRIMYYLGEDAYWDDYNKTSLFSVRCVKD